MKKYWVAVILVAVLGVAYWWVTNEMEDAEYHSEQIEKERKNQFFSELNSIYGYYYSSKDGSIQLFLKINEALREGEVTATLHVMEHIGNGEKQYKETKYELNGITDGKILEFFTTVDGESVKLEGHFNGDAKSFDLSLWMAEEKVPFRAITEEEYIQMSKDSKK